MTVLDAIIYGLLQGLTEFLPISSSGHLALLPLALKINDPGVAFDLAMHGGTAAAVIVYFWRDIKALLIESFLILSKKPTPHRPFLWNMLISTVVTGVIAVLIKDFAIEYGRNPFFIGINLIIFGFVLYGADLLNADASLSMKTQFHWKKAFSIGLFQCLALFPGVSRSGITLTLGRFHHLDRDAAARYSFLLSLPLILGGIILEVPDALVAEESFELSSLVVGAVTAFLVGVATIHFFLKLLEKVGLLSFAIYRLILGILVLFYV